MLESYQIADRIKDILKQKGITAKVMLEEIDLSASTMTYMKTSYPQANNLTKVADYLNVSLDYLMGRTDKKEINK